MKKITAAVCGATGYSGVELLKLLANHPQVEVGVITSESKQGKRLGEQHPELIHYASMEYVSLEDKNAFKGIDVAFLCLPHEPAALAAKSLLDQGIKVIDLSAAYRIKDLNVFESTYKFTHPYPDLVEEAVYGLCEIYRDDIKTARLVANPGCYTTTALTPLIPLYQSGLLDQVSLIIDAKSGYSGAGKKLVETGLFAEVNENFYAYGIGNHRHRPEIVQELSFAAGKDIKVTFTPHIIPMDRGILATIYLEGMASRRSEVLQVLKDKYNQEPFIHIMEEGVPQAKWVAHSNDVMIGAMADKQTDRLVVVSVLDNLVKGASGQAMQNMNILFSWADDLGFYNHGRKG